MQIDQRQRVTRRVTLVGAAVNCCLAALQISFGMLGRSQALLADGLHTLSDLSTDIIVLYASKRAARVADEDHPYGHGRIETLASLLLGAILGAVGIAIGIRGVNTIFDPVTTDPEAITIVFAMLAIVAKEGLYRYTLKAAREMHSSLLESNAWHHRSDALSSLVVVIGIGTQLLGVPHMDAIAAIIVGAMILLMGLRLGRNALSELIDTGLEFELVDGVREAMLGDSGVIDVHNLRTRSMGGLGYIDAHIEVDSGLTVSEAHYIAHRIEDRVKKRFPRIIDVQIHIDPQNNAIRDAVLARLPERSKIEADLQQVWNDIAAGDRIRHIKLHYLDELIEIDLVLPVTLSGAQHAGTVSRLRQAAQDLDYIGKVNIYFTD